MRSNLGESAFRPSLLLSEPVSVPGVGSLILIDGVIHSADTLNDAVDSKKEQVCEMCHIQMSNSGVWINFCSESFNLRNFEDWKCLGTNIKP